MKNKIFNKENLLKVQKNTSEFLMMDEVEIIGAHDKALFWECLNCSEFFLRYDKEETKKYLDKANDLFIDVNDDTMEALCQERPN